MESASDSFSASDGVKIHYLRAGERGSWVVLIHGYTGSAQGNWFLNGIAPALAEHHRVVAIDCRGHGRSEKPHDPSMYGPRMARDVLELMDRLGIARAHVHGYSMGGGIMSQLLARHPERFISAAFGGSGVRETEEEWLERVPPDKQRRDAKEPEARARLQASPQRDNEALAAVMKYPWTPGERPRLELRDLELPVLAINGEYDRPHAKTHRLARELREFRNVILPGRSHLTAVMAGTIPDLYIESLVEHIDGHDEDAG
jgi:pimeloyl-ACP methyl ester carboxylesterase